MGEEAGEAPAGRGAGGRPDLQGAPDQAAVMGDRLGSVHTC